ncbi:uncharacterized protein LOC121419295 isoform X4 [Lytechinus variegatus]|uniref:uncharacterized protein LOC121419295 isoform X4 n=2 Tax=Lytechinus variegatus TaxID=7654 RepID=UPI001BB114F4|nr:uncharacterized protein LOC121419295 isoform X4 [Lytechinus variegatus]
MLICFICVCDFNYVDIICLFPHQSILPEGYTYHACHVDNFSQGDEVHFAATIRLDLRSKQDFGKWLDSFQEASSTTWRVKRTFPSVGMKIVFKKAYRCHHNTRPAKESTNAGRRVASKNTNCPADMVVSIKKSVYEGRTVSRSKDHHLPLYPAEIRLSYIHNHPIMCADALKFRDVSEEAKEELISLFKRKYGPTQAIDMIKYELQLKHGANYLLKAADRAVCPDVQFAHRLYRKVFKEEFGESTGEGMLHSLRTYISHYNTQVGSECMALDITSDNKVVMAICTPLMKRVHEEVKHASELVFIDASSNMDRYGCSVFLLLTHSCAGGLPLGVLITSSEAEGVIEAALKLYRSLLPQKCFGGRGVQGPALIMTDDSAAEQNAISHVFPASQTLLCVFHVLQATWRWLWNGKNQIPKEQRPNHLQHLKRLIYACTEEELEELYQESLQDTTLSDKFKEHLTGYYGRKEKWAIACRLDLQVRGNNTNNFCEAAMRVLKDKILERTKAFSIPQLADYMSTFLDEYYQQRLIDVANGRLQNVIASRYMPQEKSIKLHDIRQLSDSQFIVTSQTSQDRGYDVDMELGHCSCHAGKTGAPCKHQAAVVKHFNVSSTNFVPVNDPQSRLLLYKIATGNCSVPSGFFDGLMTQPSVSGDISIMDASFPAEPVIDEMESIPTSQIDPNPAVASLRAQAAAQNHFDLRGSTRSAQTSSSTNGLESTSSNSGLHG